MNRNNAIQKHSPQNCSLSLSKELLPPNLPIDHVLVLTTWCRSTLYLRMADPKDPFPRQFKVGPRRVVWRRDEVLAYLNKQLDARDAATA